MQKLKIKIVLMSEENKFKVKTLQEKCLRPTTPHGGIVTQVLWKFEKKQMEQIGKYTTLSCAVNKKKKILDIVKKKN